jgi:hypothetical protein
MHDSAIKLKNTAFEILHGFQERRHTLESELREMELRTLQVKASLEGAKLAISL